MSVQKRKANILVFYIEAASKSSGELVYEAEDAPVPAPSYPDRLGENTEARHSWPKRLFADIPRSSRPPDPELFPACQEMQVKQIEDRPPGDRKDTVVRRHPPAGRGTAARHGFYPHTLALRHWICCACLCRGNEARIPRWSPRTAIRPRL